LNTKKLNDNDVETEVDGGDNTLFQTIILADILEAERELHLSHRAKSISFRYLVSVLLNISFILTWSFHAVLTYKEMDLIDFWFLE
jgi:hypothetical protein